MSVRAPAPTTAVDLRQMGLAAFARDAINNDKLIQYLKTRHPGLDHAGEKVLPDFFIGEGLRRDLHMIVHSEDRVPATRGAYYLNPFRGMPGQFDPVAEVVLRRHANYFADKTNMPRTARLRYHVVLQTILRNVQSICDQKKFLRPADRRAATTARGPSLPQRKALLLAYLWRVFACADMTKPFIGEFWDGVSGSITDPVLRACRSVPPCTPTHYPRVLATMFPDFEGGYSKEFPKELLNQTRMPLDSVRETLSYIGSTSLSELYNDPGLNIGEIGLATRIRGRFPTHNSREIGDIVHANELRVFTEGNINYRNGMQDRKNNAILFRKHACTTADLLSCEPWDLRKCEIILGFLRWRR